MRIGAQLYTVRDFCKTPEELAEALARVEPLLTEEEEGVVRRARNARQTPTKNADAREYHRATALEALIGYLYLTGQRARMEGFLGICMQTEGQE